MSTKKTTTKAAKANKANTKTTKAKSAPKAKAQPKVKTAPRAKAEPKAKAAPAPKEENVIPAKEKKLSLLSAALEVLKFDSAALNTRQMVAAAKERGLWTPGAGKTPEQTLYSAIMREIKAKGDASRFVKDASGHFKARV